MKRGAVQTSERNQIKAAMSLLPYICPDCDTRSYWLRWDHERRRWGVHIKHHPGCPVRRSHRSESQCTRYLRETLWTSGVMVADRVLHSVR